MEYPKDLDGLRWEKDTAAKVGYVIFDRPPMNVVSFRARAQIATLIAAMDEDSDIRVIVIRGANGVYSSGGDIAGFLKVERDGMHDLAWNVAAPERAKKPVIAAIEKWAMGVAFELALAIMPVIGFSVMRQMASANTLIQSTIPDQYRGRIMAMYSMTVVGLGPFGSLAAGAMAHWQGPRLTVCAGGLLALAASAVFATRMKSPAMAVATEH